MVPMRLVEKSVLYFKEGKSDKVYEVELCEAGEGEFVVNFKYGRRGAALREGTKTVFPESEEKARKIYESLIAEKTRKGYRESLEAFENAETAPETAPGAQPADASQHPMIAAVLKRLGDVAKGKESKWTLSRILWRVGELNCDEALPDLLRLEERLSSPMERYNFAWAIGRCGAGKAEAATSARRLYDEAVRLQEGWVVRVSAEAVCLTADKVARQRFVDERLRELPESIRRDFDQMDADELCLRLNQRWQRGDTMEFLSVLYLGAWEHPQVQPAIIRFCRAVDIKPGSLRPLRHLYKLAEMRADAELYATLIYRFETTKEFFHDGGYGYHYDYQAGKSYRTPGEMQKENAKLAYSNRTRGRFRRHALATLRNLGRSGQFEEYARTATGILLQFDDAVDKGKPFAKTINIWFPRHQEFTTHFDEFGKYLIFNQLLYANSPRYEKGSSGVSWRCRIGWRPGDAVPEDREEDFPEAWDASPNRIFQLLRESRCQRVHEFAAKICRANPSFSERATIEDVVAFLSSAYEVTQKLGLDIAKLKYDSENPSLDLTKALLQSALAEARQVAAEWVVANAAFFLADINLVGDLVCAPHADIAELLGEALRQHAFAADQQAALVNLVIARLLRLEAGNEEANAHAQRAAELLNAVAADAYRQLQPSALTPLIEHGLPANLFLAAEILKQFDETKLEECGAVLMQLGLCEHAEVRNSIRPTLARLSAKNRSFGEDAFRQCYPLLLRKERYEGLHADVLGLIENDLAGFLDQIPTEYIPRMLASRHLAGKQLGWRLHQERIGLRNESMRRIAHLGNNALVEIRQAVHEHYRRHVYDVKSQLEDALRLLDSEWDDSRDFALSFFSETLGENDWTPTLLVGVCDRSHPQVQAFGRELITRYFQEEQGNEYLIKLSQHPTAELQTFATNYLERHAAGNPERIAELEHYFVTVLSRVNRGRTAKSRVLRFLGDEAGRSIAAAMVIARILKRQVVTIAQGDKATCLQLLHAIRQQYPDLDNPLTVKPPPVWASEAA